MARRTLFCFGLGFSARRLAAILVRHGWRGVGTTRDADRAAEFRASGLEPAIFTGDAPLSGEGRDAPVSASHILLSIPPGRSGDAASVSDTIRSFYRGNKRVRNDRIKHELGTMLRYPTYKDGLVQLAAELQCLKR